MTYTEIMYELDFESMTINELNITYRTLLIVMEDIGPNDRKYWKYDKITKNLVEVLNKKMSDWYIITKAHEDGFELNEK